MEIHTDQLSAIQAHIRGCELSHPNIYPVYGLREVVKGLVLWNQSFRISMTRGNSRILGEEFQ